jgi:vancomycin permeability regulator SanA
MSLRRVLTVAGAAAVVAVAVIGGSVAWLRVQAAGHVYSAAEVPDAPVALVLGKLVSPDGTPSPLLRARLELAERLYEDGRVSGILVSGDGGSRPGYDEVGAMRRWLIDRGVPADAITSDPRGFDTFDSCTRARRVFGVERAIVVTQSYHLPRAVALCRHAGIDAFGVGDDTDAGDRWGWWLGVAREQPASVLAVWDVLAR